MNSSGPSRRELADRLATQARWCAELGSPLYAHLLEHTAADVRAGGPAIAVLAPIAGDPPGSAQALRLMAAVHRMVLQGRAPALAPHYPSVGGTAGVEGAWPAFGALLEEERDSLRRLIALPCQTNEVGRCGALIGGFLAVATAYRLPLRLLEVGASGGLNLRWDHYRYSGAGASWGDPSSTVHLDTWVTAPPGTDARVSVSQRRGCDPSPVDPTSAHGRLTLTASVWADQLRRHARLRGALVVAGRVPATVDRAGVADWLPGVLSEPVKGNATVVYHSVVDQYLAGPDRDVFHATLRAAGARATRQAPLAWLRLEPDVVGRRHGIHLDTWPGGKSRRLGTSAAHGGDAEFTGAR